MRRFLALSSAIALTVMMSSCTYAQVEGGVDSFPEITIEFTNGNGPNNGLNTGSDLIGIGSQSNLPFTTPVDEDERTGDDQLTISVIALSGSGTFNLSRGVVGTLGFGIDSSGSDSAFDFDAANNESVTFAFNQDLFITQVDLNSSLTPGSNTETFEVGGIELNGATGNFPDIFNLINDDSPNGLFVAAGDGVLFRALNGTGNLDSLTVQIAPPAVSAVPEPSTAVLLVSLGMIGVARRRRK